MNVTVTPMNAQGRLSFIFGQDNVTIVVTDSTDAATTKYTIPWEEWEFIARVYGRRPGVLN